MRTILVGTKRLIDYSVRVRVKPDGSVWSRTGSR